MGIRFTIVFLLLILGSCTETVESSDGIRFSGSDLYVQRCASCHGVNGGLMGSSSPDLRESKLNGEQILEKINKGGNGMPAFKTIIADSTEKNSIVEHVLKLKK